MHVQPNPQTIEDYITAMEAGSIRINRDYQRGGGIWPSGAKSALIETIILRYPMPALYLHQRFDKDLRKPFREVVDGQQRTDAIFAFRNGKLRLSRTLSTERLRGKKFSQLDEDDQFAFQTYSLPIFLFTDATESEVCEAFRRINSHTSVLNAEEKRHSKFQGPMKWFVVSVTKGLQTSLLEWGVFKRAQLNRMSDAWLVSELLYVFYDGIHTTKAQNLDALYEKYDAEQSEPFGDETHDQIKDGFATLARWSWLPASPFTKPYQFMMLLLATMHAQHTISSLEEVVPGGGGLRSDEDVSERIGELERALDNADAIQKAGEIVPLAGKDSGRVGVEENGQAESETGAPDFAPDDVLDARLLAHADFVSASVGGKTNTEDTRTKRFKAFFWAVSK